MAESNKRKVRVLFLNTRDQLLRADVAVHVTLARALDRQRVDVWAAASADEATENSTYALFKRIPDLTLLPVTAGQSISSRTGLSRALALAGNIRGIFNLTQLGWICRRQHIDIIHVTDRPRDSLYGLLLARASGAACLIHAHTNYYAHDASRLTNWTLQQPEAIVGVSQFTAQTYTRDAHVPESKVFAVHNAIDPVQFRRNRSGMSMAGRGAAALRLHFGIPAQVPLIGCVARLSRWKGQAELLEAFAQVRQDVPDARLLLAGLNSDSAPDGQGTFEDYLKRRAADLRLTDAVTFAGFLDYEEMPPLFNALDVLAHPAWEEPFGLVLVEAMACERPVVAVEAGGIPEIIRDGQDGLLVPRQDPAAMAAALVRVLRDPALSARLGQAGRARVLQAFTPERQAAAMLTVYQQIVAQRAGYAVSPATPANSIIAEHVRSSAQLSVPVQGERL